jgi:aspartyl-tRNA synthetase
MVRKPSRRYIEVEFIDLQDKHGRTVIVYEEGAEKEKLHPLVLAAYEVCLGKKTVF